MNLMLQKILLYNFNILISFTQHAKIKAFKIHKYKCSPGIPNNNYTNNNLLNRCYPTIQQQTSSKKNPGIKTVTNFS